MPHFMHINGSDENLAHVTEHGVTPEEFEQVLARSFDNRQRSYTDPANWLVKGLTDAGRLLIVVFEWEQDIDLINPVTAYEPGEVI